MIVFHVDIIISEPIQTACSWLKLCCVLYSFLYGVSPKCPRVADNIMIHDVKFILKVMDHILRREKLMSLSSKENTFFQESWNARKCPVWLPTQQFEKFSSY